MIFYDYPMAPSPRRARIFLAEKQVEFESRVIDLATQEQLSESYAAINPACTVPALQLDDGTVLTENASIAAYLDSVYPEPSLLGVNPIDRANIAAWVWKAEFHGLFAIADALRNSAPAMKDRALTGPINYEQIPQLAERGIQRIGVFFDMLNRQLEGREFVATDFFSNADITALVAVDFARVVKMKPNESHPNILRWRESLADRPSLTA